MISEDQLETMTLDDLKVMRNKIDERIQRQIAEKKQEVVKQVRDLIQLYGLDVSEVFGRASRSGDAQGTKKVAAKYRDPVSGKTWSGRGMTPKWIAGKNRDDFLIHKTETAPQNA